MFGTNPVRKPKDYDAHGGVLRIVDIFHTIQGEGPFTGRSAVFIRTAGCNLRCWFCDTDFESNAYDIDLLSLYTAVLKLTPEKTLLNGGPKLVVLTGGEPLLQNVWPLCEALFDGGYHVQVETAGTVFPYEFPAHWDAWHYGMLTFVVSPKTTHVHATFYDVCRHWKYIVGSDTEVGKFGQPLNSNVQEHGTILRDALTEKHRRLGTVYYQPRDDGDAARNAANVARAVQLVHALPGSRLSLQVHKIAGLP